MIFTHESSHNTRRGLTSEKRQQIWPLRLIDQWEYWTICLIQYSRCTVFLNGVNIQPTNAAEWFMGGGGGGGGGEQIMNKVESISDSAKSTQKC